MSNDRQGNSLSGATVEALAHYEAAVAAFNIYRGDPLEVIDAALAAAPDFAMPLILKGHLYALATEPEATAEATGFVTNLREMNLNEREASHLAALEALVAGNWTRAAGLLDRHSLRYPRDLVALQVGHLCDFYRANARDLRDRISRALPAWSPDDPDYGLLLGMHSFGLEEAGDYDRAEDAGRAAIARQPLDCWAHHAVAHVMEMQGRAQDGVGWMIAREPHWSGDDNFFKVHNWWHRALFHLDLGQIDEVFALFDGPIRSEKSAVALDLVDASALLWRLCLDGHDVGDRWGEVAATWDQHADGKLYAFNDWHAAMAYLGSGRQSDVDRLLKSYAALDPAASETARWSREIGKPLIEGFDDFWHGRYAEAVEKLHGARFIVNAFGGSHAQRDVIDWTLTEAALRGGLKDVATGLANERLALKPHSPVNARFLKRAKETQAAA